MSAVLSSIFGAGSQLFTNTGVVLSGGKLYTYLAGTSSPQPTWTDSTAVTPNANPIILDSAGRPPNEVWLQNNVAYKFILTDSTGVTLGTWDNVPGINSSSAVLTEWAIGLAASYVSASSFTVSGNNVAIYQVNRRIQYNTSAGTAYGTIQTSSYNSGTGLTTVTFAADSIGADSSLGTVNYGFMSAINSSVPSVFASLTSPAFLGVPTAPTAATATNTAQIATTAYVQNNVINYAGLSSPAFSGTPTAPTAAVGTNNTQLATTAFVAQSAFSAALPAQSGNSGKFVTTDGSNASWAYATLVPVIVTLTTATATSSNNYFLTNVAATQVTANVTPVDKEQFAVTPLNSLATNSVDFGSATVIGPFGSATGVFTLDAGSQSFQYSTTLTKWVML